MPSSSSTARAMSRSSRRRRADTAAEPPVQVDRPAGASFDEQLLDAQLGQQRPVRVEQGAAGLLQRDDRAADVGRPDGDVEVHVGPQQWARVAGRDERRTLDDEDVDTGVAEHPDDEAEVVQRPQVPRLGRMDEAGQLRRRLTHGEAREAGDPVEVGGPGQRVRRYARRHRHRCVDGPVVADAAQDLHEPRDGRGPVRVLLDGHRADVIAQRSARPRCRRRRCRRGTRPGRGRRPSAARRRRAAASRPRAPSSAAGRGSCRARP